MFSLIKQDTSNLREYVYKFNNKVHVYYIYINEAIFKPGASSLAYINISNTPIAAIFIEDYSIIFQATDNCLLIDNIHYESYTSFIPERFIDLLDINAESNLSKLNISIEEKNQFEFVVYKKDGELYKEHPLELHKQFEFLDSSLDSFIEELKSSAIFFIQGDYINYLDDFFDTDNWYLPPLADDDFENFSDYTVHEDSLISNQFLD